MAEESRVSPVREGDVLEGKYRVERVLGVGGMGVVVAATHMQLDQRVALKFLLPQALNNADVVARFAREARAAARIQSEHVARVIDVATMQNGAPYMVMEYLDGADLAETLRSRGAFSVSDAVDYLLQACEAIAEAHAAGIVHRDLKPGNLFLARRPGGGQIVKVLDFGISKTGGLDGAMTKTTAVMGSPLYMSPEQLKSSRHVDARSDVWSLGIILHELLTGSVPYQAETMPQLCAMILSEPPPPLRQVRPDAPPAVEAVILRCLQQDPARRFQNVAELAGELAAYGSPKSTVSADKIARVLSDAGALSAPLPQSMPPRAGGPATDTSWGNQSNGALGFAPTAMHGQPTLASATPPAAKSKLPLVLGVLGVVGVLGAGVLAFALRGSPASAAARPDERAAVSASAPDASTVQVSITAHPANAKIWLDDAAAGDNPYTVRMRRDGAGHRVRVEAPGRETETRMVVFDKDVTLELTLAETKTAAPTPPAPVADAPAKAQTTPAAAAPPQPAKRKLYDNPF